MLVRQHLPRVALLTAFLLSACEVARNRVTGPDGARITRVFVAPDTVMLDPSESFQFGAFGRTTAGDTPVSAAWTATAGTVTQTGLYTADTSENDVDVTASLTDESAGTLTGTARVRKRRVVAILLTPASVTLLAASTQQFNAVGLRNTGDTVPVSVAYSASGGTITNGGLFTAGPSAGTYRVIATQTRGPLADTSAVTITTVPVASVTVTPASAGVAIGGTVQLAAAARDAAGNVLNGRNITWTSDAPTVATVSATGLVRGVAVGNATITATSEGQSGTAAVSVTLPPVASVTVSPSSTSLLVGGTVQLSATLKDAGGNVLTGRSVSWTSDAPGIATVSAAGLASGVAPGGATITATSEGKSGTAALTVTALPPPGTLAGYYVAPGGSSTNDGSSTRPWTLAYALGGAGGRIRPGDTVWVRGGTYYAPFRSTLVGTALAPIVVRAYPGERAIIDGVNTTSDNFVVAGSWSVMWGLEFTSTAPSRYATVINHNYRANTVINNGPHNKYINIVIHDGGVAFFNYPQQWDVEVHGSIIYNNGWQAPDRGHGHAMYIKSDVGPVVARDNVLFNQYGYGIHVYTNSGSGWLNNIWLEGNVSFGSGSLSPSGTSANIGNLGQPLANALVVKNNMTYFAPSLSGSNLVLGSGDGLTATGNYVVGGAGMSQGSWTNATVTGNTVLSATAAAPTKVFVRPNAYEPGRANIIVYNPSGQGSVTVDLSGVVPAGARYEVRNVQDLFGAPVASGTYGGPISIPMGGVRAPTPVGLSSSPAPTTGPYFDVFIVTIVSQ
jgi:uncharacterized protein YjdB